MATKSIFKVVLLATFILIISLNAFTQIAGEGWTRIGVSYSGNITALAISPNYDSDQTLFIGVKGNGIWRSSDRGQSWKMCLAIPSNFTVTGIALPKDYIFGQGKPLFAVTSEGYFYRSDDDFSTITYSYQFVGNSVLPCTSIVVGGSTSFDGKVFVGTWGGGVWLNQQGGDPSYWTNISSEKRDMDYCWSLTITASQRIWASTAPPSGSQPIWRWEGGYSWTSFGGSYLTNEETLVIHSSWANEAYMWAGTKTKGMWKSTDYGNSWSLACDGSTSGGLSFQVKAIRDCPQSPSDQEIWEGRSDGLKKSTNYGTSCSDSFPSSNINVIEFAPSYHGTSGYCDAFVGTESALFRINCSEGPVAKTPPAVDGKCVAIAHNGNGTFLGSLSRGLFKSVDRATMVEYNNFPNGKIPQIVGIALHPFYDESGSCGDSNTLFVAANFPDSPSDNGVYKSVDGGNSWTKLTQGDWPTSSNMVMRDIAISPNFATDKTLFAALYNYSTTAHGQIYRLDDTTSSWTRVATDNLFEDVTFIALPPQYNFNSTCSYLKYSGVPCNMVIAGVETASSYKLAVSYNNGGYFSERSTFQNPTGIAFPKNYCTGSSPSTKSFVSSSTLGILGTTDVLFGSYSQRNSGLPSSLNVADISADPDWVDSASPTDPNLICAVPVSSTPSTRDFGIYLTTNGGDTWSQRQRGRAISVAFELPSIYYNCSLALSGFERDATYGTDPPYGAFYSNNGGANFAWLSGYRSLPDDVFSSVMHERDSNYIFAASPSMGVFVSKDKGESFHPYNVGLGGALGPCRLTNGYGITMLADRRGSNLDILYVGTTDGIKSRYIYYDSTTSSIDLEHEDASGTTSGWRHSTLSGGGNTTGYWERIEVVPNSSQNYPIWAVSPSKPGYTEQGFAQLPAGNFEGWVFQNGGLSSLNAKGVRIGYSSGSATAQPLVSGAPIKGSVKQGEWDYYSIDVTNPDKDLQIFLDDPDDYGPMDADLYVRYGSIPDLSNYDYSPYINGDENVCVVPILNENFDETWGPYGDNPPPQWSIYNYGSESPNVWNYNDWHRYSNGTYGYSARVYSSPLENQLEDLDSPYFNIPSTLSSATLEFDHYFRNYNATGEYGRVWFISDQTSWVKLAEYTTTTGGMVHQSISLSPYIGHTNCRLAFQYEGYNGWYWIVDNIRVTGYTTPRPQKLRSGTWYIGVRGYASGDNGYTLTATLNSGCSGTFAEIPPGSGKDLTYANYIPPNPKAPIGGSAWGTVNGSGVYKGVSTTLASESSKGTPEALTWYLRNGSTYPLSNLNAKTIIQLPDTTLVVGCDASSSSDKGIFYSPAGDEGVTTWREASSVAGTSSKNYVDIIRASNGDVLIAANGTGATPGGVWLSGDKGRNWMRISQGFDTTSQQLEDIVADSGIPPSYYASTDSTGLWTRTITASPYPTITSIVPNNGSDQGGTSVTITGTNFSNSCPTGDPSDCPSSTPIVIFDDIEVAGSWVNSTQITAITPPHPAGVVTVYVRNPDTRQTVVGSTYTFNFTCVSPSGMVNNSASDIDPCADTGVLVSWSAPSNWGDGGSGTRSYDVLRDGIAIVTGLSSSTTNYTDTTGVNGVSYAYSVRANNGCGQSFTTSGASASDNISPSAPVIDSIIDNDPNSLTGITINYTPSPSAASHDLYKDGILAQSNFISGSTYFPGDSNIHSYFIRATQGSCYTDSSPVNGQDATASIPPPEIAPGDTYETAQVWSSDKATQSWPSSSQASGYYLYRLTLSDLPNLQNSTEEGCKRDTLSSNSYNCSLDDPSVVSGRVYFYLVTGYNGAGEGSAGNGSGFGRNLSTSVTCP